MVRLFSDTKHSNTDVEAIVKRLENIRVRLDGKMYKILHQSFRLNENWRFTRR